MNQASKKQAKKHDIPFKERFRELFNQENISQEALGKAIGVQRATIASWLDGYTVPNAIYLGPLSQHYGVSADYLLGLTDVQGSNVSLKAAVAYTGLSEKAIENLHSIFKNNRSITIPNYSSEEVLRAASELIESSAFGAIAYQLREVKKWGYLFNVVQSSQIKYFSRNNPNDPPKKLEKDAQKIISANLIARLQNAKFFCNECDLDRARRLVNFSLDGDAIQALHIIKEKRDQAQFLVVRELLSYLDRLLRETSRKAVSGNSSPGKTLRKTIAPQKRPINEAILPKALL